MKKYILFGLIAALFATIEGHAQEYSEDELQQVLARKNDPNFCEAVKAMFDAGKREKKSFHRDYYLLTDYLHLRNSVEDAIKEKCPGLLKNP